MLLLIRNNYHLIITINMIDLLEEHAGIRESSIFPTGGRA